MKEIDIKIGDKLYTVKVAETELEKTIGLSQEDDLKKDEGMLFVYNQPLENLWFTMEETSLDLDIIFINSDLEVTSVLSVEAYTEEPIPDEEGNSLFVLEVPINSGILVGDFIEEVDDSFTESERDAIEHSRMLILDENGDVQYKLHGGERICSRIFTRKLVKLAIKAWKTETDEDFVKLGKMIFKELDALDSRKPLYVESPESKDSDE